MPGFGTMPKLLSSKTTHGVPFLNIKVMMDLSFPSKPAINCTYCPETPNQKWSKIEASLQKQLCSKNTGTILKIFNIICAKNQPTNSSTILLIHFFFYFLALSTPLDHTSFASQLLMQQNRIIQRAASFSIYPLPMFSLVWIRRKPSRESEILPELW